MGWFKLSSNYSWDSSRSLFVLPHYYSDEDEITPKAVIIHPRSRKRHCVASAVEAAERSGSDNDSLSSSDESDCSSNELSSSSSNDNGRPSKWNYKYQYLKRLAKRMIRTNVALASELEQLESDIDQKQQEKRYLFKRLLDLQSQDNSKPLIKSSSTVTATDQEPTITITKPKKPRPSPKSSVAPSLPPATTATSKAVTAIAAATSSSERLIYNTIAEPRDLFSTSSSSEDDDLIEPEVKSISSKPIKPSSVKDEGTVGGGGRKKRIRRLQPILLKDDGSPVFPIKLGGLHVLSLGKVVWDRPSFHNERYIWPLGFESTRSYPSMLVPSRRCLYTCRILDGKDGPIFEMVSEESRDSPIRASSATACHHTVLKAINAARDKQATNAGSGPEFFGFSHPSILNLIQMLPGAEKCTKYKPTQFQQPLSRGKATTSTNTKKPVSKQRVKSVNKSSRQPSSPLGDPSLAPVVGLNTQLTSLNEFSSSMSSDLSDSDTNLTIDHTNTNTTVGNTV